MRRSRPPCNLAVTKSGQNPGRRRHRCARKLTLRRRSHVTGDTVTLRDMPLPLTLVPYPSSGTPAIRLTASIERRADLLLARYRIEGSLEHVLFPASSARAHR